MDADYIHMRKLIMEIEEIINYENLYKAMLKCKANVLWKDSVATFFLNGVERCIVLERQLNNGEYRPRKPMKFFVTSPKRREIISVSFRDRTYQRVLNDEYIYSTMTKSFIYDNWACQKGKGTDGARNRLKEFMRKEYRKNGADGYVLKIDIKGYYPSMDHSYVESMFASKMDESVAERAIKILKEQYDGDKGYNPGSQLVQIAGISALDRFDHYVKELLKAKLYLRYMDDMILIHKDKEVLITFLDGIKKELGRYGFEINEKKTEIVKLKNGIQFLGFLYRLTDSGKIIMTVPSENVKRERRKLYRAVSLAKSGILTKKKVDEMYISWKAHASKGNSYKMLSRMDAYYYGLWRNINVIQKD